MEKVTTVEQIRVVNRVIRNSGSRNYVPSTCIGHWDIYLFIAREGQYKGKYIGTCSIRDIEFGRCIDMFHVLYVGSGFGGLMLQMIPTDVEYMIVEDSTRAKSVSLLCGYYYIGTYTETQIRATTHMYKKISYL